MTTFAHIPIDKLVAHPRNIRREAIADEETIASIQSNGILQAITVVEQDDNYLIIAGHRRLDGARKAGLTTVPAMIRLDLVTEEQHIEAMAIENVQRVDLTPIEEAEAYEQLTLVGYKPKDIAKATGRSLSTVQSRLKLTTLDDVAKAAIHARDLNLEDAISLTELEDFPELLADVEAAIGTPNFDYKLINALNGRNRERGFVATRAAYLERGLTKLEKPDEGWNYAEGPRPIQDETIADAWYEDQYAGPCLAVTKFTAPEPSAQNAQADSEWELKQSEREAARQASNDAQEVRLGTVKKFAESLKVPKGIGDFLRLAVPELVAENVITSDLAGTFTKATIDTTVRHWQRDRDAIRDEIHKLSEGELFTLVLLHLVEGIDDSLDRITASQSSARIATGLDYLGWLTENGHTACDIDVAFIEAGEDRLVELQGADES